jgi:hypothetical protein
MAGMAFGMRIIFAIALLWRILTGVTIGQPFKAGPFSTNALANIQVIYTPTAWTNAVHAHNSLPPHQWLWLIYTNDWIIPTNHVTFLKPYLNYQIFCGGHRLFIGHTNDGTARPIFQDTVATTNHIFGDLNIGVSNQASSVLLLDKPGSKVYFAWATADRFNLALNWGLFKVGGGAEADLVNHQWTRNRRYDAFWFGESGTPTRLSLRCPFVEAADSCLEIQTDSGSSLNTYDIHIGTAKSYNGGHNLDFRDTVNLMAPGVFHIDNIDLDTNGIITVRNFSTTEDTILVSKTIKSHPNSRLPIFIADQGRLVVKGADIYGSSLTNIAYLAIIGNPDDHRPLVFNNCSLFNTHPCSIFAENYFVSNTTVSLVGYNTFQHPPSTNVFFDGPGIWVSTNFITVSLTADNQVVYHGYTRHLKLSSNTGVAGDRTILMAKGNPEQIMVLQCVAGAFELADNSAVTGGGNCRLNATWTAAAQGMLTLKHDGTDWVELGRSPN